MSAKKIKVRTTVTEYDVQELSLDAIEWIPESLQTRATLDQGWVLQYTRGYIKGEPFPAVLVYRLPPDEEHPDGRLVLVDGFHRYDARRQLGLKTVEAQVRDGTMHEALLAAIDANTAAYHRGRPFDDRDRIRAVELMIRDEEVRSWSDSEIARRAGTSRNPVQRARLRLEEQGIPIPDRVKSFSPSGQPIGKWVKYRRSNISPIYFTKDGRYIAKVRGRSINLGRDPDEARARFDSIQAEREQGENVLSTATSFFNWLIARRVSPERLPADFLPGGLRIRDVVVIPGHRLDFAGVLQKIGHATLIRKAFGDSTEVVVVCYLAGLSGPGGFASRLAAAEPGPIRFLTPAEFAAEFAPPAHWPEEP